MKPPKPPDGDKTKEEKQKDKEQGEESNHRGLEIERNMTAGEPKRLIVTDVKAIPWDQWLLYNPRAFYFSGPQPCKGVSPSLVNMI